MTGSVEFVSIRYMEPIRSPRRKTTPRRKTELARRIATWREAKRLSLADLARAADVTRSAICHYEAGKAEPSHARLTALVVDGLGISMSRFYGPLPRMAA